MGGTLSVTDSLFWVPAGWVFDNVLDGIACYLKDSNPALSQRFYGSKKEMNGGFLDLENIVDPDLFEDIICALVLQRNV